MLYVYLFAFSVFPKISISGKHVMKSSINQTLEIEDLEFWIDSNVIDRSTPLFSLDNPLLTMDYSLRFENVRFFVDSGIQDAPIMNWKSAALSFELNGCMLDGTLFNASSITNVFHGIFFVDFSPTITPPQITINKLNIQNTDGSAVVLRNIDAGGSLVLTKSTFIGCSRRYDDSCLFFEVAPTTSIVMKENTISRSGALISGKTNGTFITGCWISISDGGITLNDVNQTIGLAKNITIWTMQTSIGVGIRFDHINFSPAFLATPPLAQQNSIRKISEQNLAIDTTFHDIMYNTNDGEIQSDDETTKRGFCSDGCPVSDISAQMRTIYIVGGFVLLFVIIAIIVCVGPLSTIFLSKSNPYGFYDRNKKRTQILKMGFRNRNSSSSIIGSSISSRYKKHHYSIVPNTDRHYE